jgi:hypothetical protein
MKYNPSAPAHRSARCRDRANTFSEIPMEKRMYDHGQRIIDGSATAAQPTPDPPAP